MPPASKEIYPTGPTTALVESCPNRSGLHNTKLRPRQAHSNDVDQAAREKSADFAIRPWH